MLQKKDSNRRSALLLFTIVLTGLFVSPTLIAQTNKPVRNTSADKQNPTIAVGDLKTMEDGRAVYTRVEQMPEFNGNMPEWLEHNIKYPASARKKNQQGRSVMQFVIEPDGHIADAKVVRSSGFAELDEESMRVINKMPNWTAGKHLGQTVPVLFTLPITYKLD